MNELTNACFPKRMLSRRQFKTSKNPWITPGILTSIKHKNRLYAKFLKNKSPTAHTDYKKYRNKLTHLKEAAKKIYYQKLLLGPGNPSNTWKNINQFLRKNKPKSTVPSLVKVGDKTITDPTEICNKLNEHFVTISEKLGSKSIFQNNHNYRKYLGKRHVSSVILQPTHACEIMEIITGLDINKSPGYIDINRRLVYRLRASTWQPVDWGFIPSRVILKTLKIVFAAFAPGARHKRKCEGFCVCVVRHVMSLNSVQSFVIENCNGPTIENGLNNVCLHPLSRTFTFFILIFR